MRVIGLALGFLLTCSILSAASFAINGSGSWSCGFYPGGTGYGADDHLNFTSKDAQGNPITGTLDWGNQHASPPCVQGLQPFSGAINNPLDEAAISGSYTYLGQSYSTIPASAPLSACVQPGCSISVNSDQGGDISLTLGYLTPNGTAFLDLFGTAGFTSSNFGTEAINLGGNTFQSLYSNGTFVVPAAVPEPAAWALMACGAVFLVSIARRKHKIRI